MSDANAKVADTGSQAGGLARQTPASVLMAEVDALTKALTGLTCGGSEFFSRRGERYVADIEACVSYVRRVKEDAHRLNIRALGENRRLREALKEAENALASIAEYWNGDRNEDAMHDACERNGELAWVAADKARAALANADEKAVTQ